VGGQYQYNYTGKTDGGKDHVKEIVRAASEVTAERLASGACSTAPLEKLCDLVDEASSTQAEQIGRTTRETGILRKLVALLGSSNNDALYSSLFILGNVSSDVYDPHAMLTKRLLNEMDAFAAVLRHISSTEADVAHVAVGAMQNMCCNLALAQQMKAHGADRLLEGLLASDGCDLQVRELAKGCLTNMHKFLVEEGPTAGSDATEETGGGRAHTVSASLVVETLPVVEGLLAVPKRLRSRDRGPESPQFNALAGDLSSMSTVSPSAVRRDRLRATDARSSKSPYLLRRG